MIYICHECCYATLVENGTHQYYKCGIMETIRNERARSGCVQTGSCKYFKLKLKKIFKG